MNFNEVKLIDPFSDVRWIHLLRVIPTAQIRNLNRLFVEVFREMNKRDINNVVDGLQEIVKAIGQKYTGVLH